MLELNKIYNMDCADGLKMVDDNSIDLTITSPPYWNLRNYGCNGQIGLENTVTEYINNLITIFEEVYRVTKKDGSCWVNIDDKYYNGGLCCIPDRFKIAMCDIGWICRNEIIWHKPNAMPCSAKNRFNNDYEKFYFFTKSKNYYFKTQYEPLQSKIFSVSNHRGNDKYESIEQESSVRQGLNKSRGTKLVYLRKSLPSQEEFVDFIRSCSNAEELSKLSGIKKSKIEHWYRRDNIGFAFPSADDWELIKPFLKIKVFDDTYNKIDFGLTDITVETDDILKNIDKGRIKRTVWDISTKAYKGCHYATFPEELITTPINACCIENGTVLDPFMGSGTVGVVAKRMNKNFIGFELNNEYCKLATERINNV